MTKPIHCSELAGDGFDMRHASADGENQWQNSFTGTGESAGLISAKADV